MNALLTRMKSLTTGVLAIPSPGCAQHRMVEMPCGCRRCDGCATEALICLTHTPPTRFLDLESALRLVER